jgi:hypothetical protein
LGSTHATAEKLLKAKGWHGVFTYMVNGIGA